MSHPTDPPRPPKLVTAFALALFAGVVANPLPAATIVVDTLLDADAADGFCSLREAIFAANGDTPRNECPAGAGPDRIVLAPPASGSILLSSALPAITNTTLLRGPGAALLTLDGQETYRLLRFQPGPDPALWLGIEDLTLARGFDSNRGGALYAPGARRLRLQRVALLSNRAGTQGGAIEFAPTFGEVATADLLDCWFEDNESLGTIAVGGGAIHVTGGGSSTQLNLVRSSMHENRASGAEGRGGAIYAFETNLRLDRCTLSGNTATGNGGAVHISLSSGPFSLAIADSTLTLNVSDFDGVGGDSGGGLHSVAFDPASLALELTNSIVAGNSDGVINNLPDLVLGGENNLVATGFNLIGSNTGEEDQFPAGLPNVNGDYVGTNAALLDPQLGAFSFHGGLIPTHRPLLSPLSPAVDAGYCPTAMADQRGFGDAANGVRTVDLGTVPNGSGSDGCDIGAHERDGVAGADRALFADGFELGDTLLWSSETL